LTLRHPFLEANPTRCYDAHMWQEGDSSPNYPGADEPAWWNSAATTDSDMVRLYEDPDYLQQHVVYWDDNDVSWKTATVEHEAYITYENAIYLQQVCQRRT